MHATWPTYCPWIYDYTVFWDPVMLRSTSYKILFIFFFCHRVIIGSMKWQWLIKLVYKLHTTERKIEIRKWVTLHTTNIVECGQKRPNWKRHINVLQRDKPKLIKCVTSRGKGYVGRRRMVIHFIFRKLERTIIQSLWKKKCMSGNPVTCVTRRH